MAFVLLAGNLLAVAIGIGAAPQARTVPEGTELQIRLRHSISSHSTVAGTDLRAMVIAPVEIAGQLTIPMGSEVHGAVTAVRRVGFGFIRERAFVEMTFDRLRLPDGRELPVALRITRVDDARESVDATGRIVGIRATSSFASSLSGLATTAGVLDPMLLAFVTASSLSAFRIPESEVVLPAGAELRARLLQPVEVTSAFQPGFAEYRARPADREALVSLVRALPFRTQTGVSGVPSDITNLMFVGSRDALAAAFDAAGWGQTDALDARSKYLALRAVIENQGYREAPMSTLVLGGRRPELTYAKTLNTFFERHHLRIFASAATLDDAPVWSSSSTHDAGIGFAVQRKTLIHLVDENIDEEREKVVHDLVLTGCVDGVTHVDRPWLPDDLSNSTGDTLRTDKRIAVLRLNGCAQPVRADLDLSDASAALTRRRASSGIRDTVLTLKNDFWRGNILYQSYTLTKLGIAALRRKEPSPEGRSVEIGGERFLIVRSAEARQRGRPEEAPDEDDDPGFDPPGSPRSYDTRLMFSASGATSVRTADAVSTLAAQVDLAQPAPLSVRTTLRSEWGIGARVTLGSWSHVSQEFSYASNRMTLGLELVEPGAPVGEVTSGAQVRQFGYSVLLHALPNGRRLRPYGAIGPLLQMTSLDDAIITSTGGRTFGLIGVGFLASTWEFGSKPPLEGGGIFQLGVQYGAGVTFNLTPHLVLRGDVRESLSASPDFLTKSTQTLRSMGVTPTSDAAGAPLRLRQVSLGLGFGF